MGDPGTAAGLTGDLVLDAGALIALERGDRELIALLRGAVALDYTVVIPATALAQAWRGGPRSASLARLVAASEIDGLDEGRAKEVGSRLGERGGRDVADAHVVCCAVVCGAAVATSDPDDIRALVGPGEALALISLSG